MGTAPRRPLVLGLEFRIYAAWAGERAEPPKGGTPNGGRMRELREQQSGGVRQDEAGERAFHFSRSYRRKCWCV